MRPNILDRGSLGCVTSMEGRAEEETFQHENWWASKTNAPDSFESRGESLSSPPPELLIHKIALARAAVYGTCVRKSALMGYCTPESRFNPTKVSSGGRQNTADGAARKERGG